MKNKLALTILAAFAVAPLVAMADTSGTTYAQAEAAYEKLLVPTTPPTPATPDTYATRAAALQVVIAAPDISVAQKTAAYDQLGHMQRFAGQPASVYLDSYHQAYLLGSPAAFMDYLGYALESGDSTAASQAIAEVPQFAHSFPDPQNGVQAQARVADFNKDFDASFTLWQSIADSYTSYETARGYAILKAAQAARARGDKPAQINQFLIPYLTALNVPFADPQFRAAYDMVNRSPKVQPTSSTADFLNTLLVIIDPTQQNSLFLGKVQSQLNLLPPAK